MQGAINSICRAIVQLREGMGREVRDVIGLMDWQERIAAAAPAADLHHLTVTIAITIQTPSGPISVPVEEIPLASAKAFVETR